MYCLLALSLTNLRGVELVKCLLQFCSHHTRFLTPAANAVELVAKHGDTIAGDVRAMCAKYKIEDTQIAGFGFDGQK